MANITLLDLARQGKLGPFKDPQAAVDNYYKTNPLMARAPERVAAQNQGATQEMVARGILNPDGTYNWKNDANAQEANLKQTLINQSPNPKPPTTVYKSEQEQAPREMTKADLQAQQASWTRTLPEHLKPRIEKDEDGNEIVTIQGSLLNKIMRDMYTAGEENYQLQNMPIDSEISDIEQTPVQQQPVQQPVQTPYDSRVSIPNPSTADPYASTIIRELQNAYPQRSLEEILKLLQGG